ncbi:MAG: hypothetical protein AAB573_02030 [Patescibacteria group bacterium]
MDEVVISGKKYISSKRAARTSGYAPDYIGQLVRESKLQAVKVGRAWFVAEMGLQELVAGPGELSVIASSATLPETWSPVIYMKDDAPLYPIAQENKISDTRENDDLSHHAEEKVVKSVEIMKIALPKRSNGISLDGIKQIPKEIKAIGAVSISVTPKRRVSRLVGYALSVLFGVLFVTILVFLISLFY